MRSEQRERVVLKGLAGVGLYCLHTLPFALRYHGSSPSGPMRPPSPRAYALVGLWAH